MTAAGIEATMTFFQSSMVSDFSWCDFMDENGLSFSKFRTTTAKMAPSWMTTRNMSMNCFDTCNLMNSSTRIIWPVLETGSHSVSPSTTPSSTVFNRSAKVMSNLISS